MVESTFWKRVKSAMELKEQIKILQDQLDSVNGDIKKYMSDNEENALENKKYSVKYSTFVRTSFDSTSFKRDQPDLYTQYVKQSNSDRLTINAL